MEMLVKMAEVLVKIAVMMMAPGSAPAPPEALFHAHLDAHVSARHLADDARRGRLEQRDDAADDVMRRRRRCAGAT